MQSTIRFFVALTCILLASCQWVEEKASATKDALGALGQGDVRRNIIVLLDASGSTSDKQKEAYIKAIELIYKTLSSRDRLIISTIDGGSYIDPARVVSEDFGRAKTENDLMFEPQLAGLPDSVRKKYAPPFFRKAESIRASGKRREQERLAAYKDHILPRLRPLIIDTYKKRAQYGGDSNILWALKNIESDLEDNQDKVAIEDGLTIHNYIVLLSDMVHENDEISFDKGMGILRPESEALLLKLSNTNRIPSFNGANIICLGRAKTAIIKSEAGVQNVQEFWNGYFSKKYANGIVLEYAAIDKIERLDDWLNEWKDK